VSVEISCYAAISFNPGRLHRVKPDCGLMPP
jgi:hypothetical protein